MDSKKLSWWGVFGVVSLIIGFVVDFVAFWQLVGLDIIFAPTANTSPDIPSIVVELPANTEIITFMIWLYTAIATLIFSGLTAREYGSRYYSSWDFPLLIPLPFFCLVPTFFVIWLWVFGYLPVWLYIFLVATLLFSGLV
ncbi:MAG: hypothetical protein AAF485_28635, partial [Chloroflexota bacterium]